jgi:3-phenylpropionate/trans-cinnamate dioxygenase ferredoxin reductase subunit
LAHKAGLATGNGILANAYLQTSHPDIYAAGDGASVWDQWIGENKRVEHWDNALNQGKQAGKNMAGAQQRYTHMSYFFSDLFEFGYEAVGRIDSKLPTVADWQEENSRGVVYYVDDNKVRGVLLCNIWEKIEAATDLIKQDRVVTIESLRGAIR